MNYENNEMLTSPNLSYTSRDYNTIYNELMKSIPLLTKSWNPTDENDPGVVIIKLLSMLGDMLSYNLDKAALEAFPRTVLLRSNAQQIFRLIGYKMHWWRSARIEASFTNANTFPIYIDRYNVFSTSDANISYTNISDIIIPSGTYGDAPYIVELIQGTPVTPVKRNYDSATTKNWYDMYDYNVQSDEIINNKLYLKYSNIDETSITIIDNDETPFASNEWTQVENINLSETMDKVFEFDVDENNTPFIQFPNYWQEKYVITKFKMFLVLSDGKNGEIEENTLTRIGIEKCHTNNETVSIGEALELVEVFNSPSTYGYNPETCVEARKESEKYQNTIDTLVTLRDFEKATMRIDSVANVIATDIQMDPHPEELLNNEVKLYIVRKSDYSNAGSDYIYQFDNGDNSVNDEIFKENIIGELKSYKVLPVDATIYLENYIDWIDWTVTGQIFLRKPINADQNYDLMVRINNNLKNRFNCETLDFNEPINYMDVIECIMKTDKNIWHVDLDTASIQYSRARRSLKGNSTGFTIQDKYRICNEKGEYTGYYVTSLGCTDIEINKISPYVDVYGNIYNNENPYYLAGTGANDLNKTVYVNNERSNNSEVANDENITVTPGGDGYGKNAGNRIIREDGVDYVIGLFGLQEPREYEIYNKRIYDWTGLEPIFTGKVINTNTMKIQEYDEYGNLVDTGYTLLFDSRMYSPDGSDAGRYLQTSYRQITQLCDITSEDDILTNSEINDFGEDKKLELVAENKIREVWLIIDREYNEPTGDVIDKLTGEIFRQRGNHWYSMKRSYDVETGEILDTYGPVLYDENYGTINDPACREDVSCEYVNHMTLNEDQTEFNFYLGQDLDGTQMLDSKGEPIQGYPIRPYSLFIYIDGDIEVLADTGSGTINGTPGLLNGHGTINYATGHVSFKLNIVPKSMKILYKVNKFTYARYQEFDTSKLFVRPEYLRADYRK